MYGPKPSLESGGGSNPPSLNSGGSSWENNPIDSSISGETWNNAQEYLQWNAANQGFNTVSDMRQSLGDDGIQDLLNAGGYTQQDLDDFSDADAEKVSKGMADAVKSLNGGSQMNAANVTITASTVNMDGNTNLSGANNFAQALEEASENVNGSSDNESDSEKNKNVFEIEEGKGSFGDTLAKYKDLGLFEQIGDAFVGLGGITDTLYVDGQAPQEGRQMLSQWVKETGEKRKANVERDKDNWAHNKDNIKIMTDKYMNDPSFREKYSDKPEAYIRREAEKKAKEALKDMSAYVPYGVRDVNTAYGLYKHANDNNLSPQQAMVSLSNYNNFNTDSANIDYINKSPAFQGENHTSVESAIPNAQVYFNNGYTDIKSMANVEWIAQSLGQSPAFAMKVDEALKRKGGKINYKGTDENMKDAVAQINRLYGG